RLLSELFFQCGIIKRIEGAQFPDLLEEQRAKFINGYILSNMSMLKEAVKVPNHPLLMKKSSRPLPEIPPMIFDNDPKDVVLEYMRLMKDEGITITGADIAPAPTEDRKGKRVDASGSGKDKAEVVVKETKKRAATSVSDKENVTKKQRIQKKRAPRKLVLQEENEETDEEPMQSKRKRTKPEAKEMNVEADVGKSHSNTDNVLNSQAQNQNLSEIDLDPSLLQPLNTVYPAKISDLPPITSETDLDSVAEGIK
ncbi:hypothetical protein A2U01_0033092, partial [Trifolium medium]|nr:hypothetical protein [Trifolium medium]